MRPDLDTDRLRAAIEAAERRTSAEVMVAMSPFFIGRIERAAHRAFARLGVARTRGRNGVLVFVVPRRHQVVVLPDVEAEARVDPSAWRDAAAFVAAGFGTGRPTDGLVDAIGCLATALAGPFPATAHDLNELPDHPVGAGLRW
jgi:putative membrane protein